MTYPPSGDPAIPPAGNPYGPVDPYSVPPDQGGGYAQPYSQYPVEGGQYSAPPYQAPQSPFPGAPQQQYPGAGQFPGQPQFPGQGQPQFPGAQPYPGQQFPGYQGQPGYPVPAPGAGRRSSTPWLIAGLVLVVALLAGVMVVLTVRNASQSLDVATPTSSTDRPVTGRSTGAPTGSSSAKPGGPGARYKPVDDMCAVAADLSPVGDWAKTKSRDSKYQSTSEYVSLSSCDFTLRSASNSIVILSVSIKIFGTVDQAARSYSSMYQAQKGTSKFDGVQSGIGEEAFGFGEPSSTQTTYYMMCSRISNAYLEVSATVSGSPSKDEMRPKMIAESKAILAKLPTA